MVARSAGRREPAGIPRRAASAAKDVFTYAGLIAACIISLAPLVYLLATSLTKTFSPVADLSVLLHPNFSNYGEIWSAYPFAAWLKNSLIVATSVTVLSLFVDSLAGYAFAKMRFRGREFLFLVLLATIMIPVPVTLLPTYLIADHFGMLDTYQALIVPALAYPVGVFLMRQFIRTIPDELLDAARVDGMSAWGIYLRIILPLSIPGLAVLALFVFLTQWVSLLWPLTVAISDSTRTVQAGLASLPGQYNTQYGLITAATICSVLPMLVVFLFLQRYLTAGLTGGRAGKG